MYENWNIDIWWYFWKLWCEKIVNAPSKIISPNCVQLWRHESWKFFARYRGAGKLKFLWGSRLLGGHNLPSPPNWNRVKLSTKNYWRPVPTSPIPSGSPEIRIVIWEAKKENQVTSYWCNFFAYQIDFRYSIFIFVYNECS